MKRRSGHKNLIDVSGDETVFEAMQVVMAALTLDEFGEPVRTSGVEAVLRLDHWTAVNALWVVLGAVLSGFDTAADRRKALQVVAAVIARQQDHIDSVFPKGCQK